MDKSPDAFRTISEVADYLETPAHVLRFWESRFPQIKPVKRAGGRRYYRPADVALLSGIKRLLHDDGMTIRGVQKILREQGVRHVAGLVDGEAALDETAFPTIDTLDAVLNPPQAAPPSAEIVPFAPRPAEPLAEAPPEPLPEPLPDPTPEAPPLPAPPAAPWAPEAPVLDTETAPDWSLAGADEVDEPPAPLPAQPPSAEPDPAPVDLWAAAGIAAPPPVPPRKPLALAEDDLPAPDLRAPLHLATRLRALTPDSVSPHLAELTVLRDRLLALREQIATAARVRAR